MGTLILATTSSASTTAAKGSPTFTFLILAVAVVLFYVLLIRPQRNRQRRAMQTQNQVVPGQRIRTTAGMYGTVVSGDDRDVVIEIAPGVQVTMLRRAIMDVVPDDAAPDGVAADGMSAEGMSADGISPNGEVPQDRAADQGSEPEPEADAAHETGHEDIAAADNLDVKDRKS